MSDVHRPSLVLELHPSKWMWCLVCQKQWSCPTEQERVNDSQV